MAQVIMDQAGCAVRDERRVGVRGGQGKAEQDQAGAQRGDKRRDPERDRDERVDVAEHQAEHQAEDHRRDGRHAVEVDQVVHQERREAIDEAHRQVQLAADQQQHLTAGDDRQRGDDLGQVDQVIPGEEGRADGAEVDDQRDRDDEHRRLALLYEPDPDPAQ
jgi:hypothetical protein